MEFIIGIVIGYFIFKWGNRRYISRKRHERILKQLEMEMSETERKKVDRFLSEHGLDFDP